MGSDLRVWSWRRRRRRHCSTGHPRCRRGCRCGTQKRTAGARSRSTPGRSRWFRRRGALGLPAPRLSHSPPTPSRSLLPREAGCHWPPQKHPYDGGPGAWEGRAHTGRSFRIGGDMQRWAGDRMAVCYGCGDLPTHTHMPLAHTASPEKPSTLQLAKRNETNTHTHTHTQIRRALEAHNTHIHKHTLTQGQDFSTVTPPKRTQNINLAKQSSISVL